MGELLPRKYTGCGTAPERLRSGTTAYSTVLQLTQDPFVMRTGAAPPDTESLEDARDLVQIQKGL